MEKQQKPTEKEKLPFLKEAALLEVTAILNKYGTYPAIFYHWKRNVREAESEGHRHEMKRKVHRK
jgi:hypothetical protein